MRKSILLLGTILSLLFLGCNDPKASDTDAMNEGNTESQLPKHFTEVEEYRIIDVDHIHSLNERIHSKNLSSKEEIMREYMPEDRATEGNYSYEIKIMNTENMDSSLVLLTVDGLQDDSVRSIKVLMRVKAENNALIVEQIKESYRCYEGRGHTEWSAYSCS